jgi:hypothetical protein
MSHDDQHPAPPPAPQPEPAAPPTVTGLEAAAPPPSGAADRADRVAPEPSYRLAPAAMRQADGTLHPIQDSAYFSADPAAIEAVSAHIDEYFNQPLDIFPFWESDGKPDRFHVLFDRQIEERFPADRDIRGHIHTYGRSIFGRLVTHFFTKRLFQGGALIGLAALALIGPTWFAGLTGSQPMGLALSVAAMAAVFGLWWAVQAILFVQYRFRLENDTYALSRRIVERTRELQNVFTQSRAMADQAETLYQQDGKGWGLRAMYLTRLTMWIGARMEYLEKFVQMQLWRVRRERYWMRWVGRIVTPMVYLTFLGVLALEPAPAGGEAAFRGLQAVAVVLGAAISWVSYFRWQTPTQLIQDKLGLESWVRYASLDVDNAVADQVRRDKERLVEYRALTRGGR